MATSSGDCPASGGGMECASEDESASSTPFVSAASSPDRDPSSFSAAGRLYSAPSSPARDPSFSVAGCFYSVPPSPARGGGQGIAEEYGCDLGFDFDFASHCPSPAVAAAMSTADELFDNGQIRPMRLASFLRRPQALLPPLDGEVHPPPQPPSEPPAPPAGADERGRLVGRSRSMHQRRYRSLSPFRSRWLSSPAPAGAKSVKPPAAASRSSSSSSSTASSASSSSSSRNRRWGFLKGIFHRSKSDGGERPLLPKRSPSPSFPAAASRGRGWARRSAHARLYEARRAEADEMRRRTLLPYRQSFLLGFLGLGSRSYGAMHGPAARP